jgi:hypothetical protein
VVISLISLAIALVALFANLGAVVRRPKISGNWGPIDDGGGRRQEGLWITVTARRRPIEVSEIGVIWFPRRQFRRQLAEWNVRNKGYVRSALDQREALLTDGQTMQTGIELHAAVERIGPRPGRDYCYVIGSGIVYFARPNRRLAKWLAGLPKR